jgi:WD40 repeat protein
VAFSPDGQRIVSGGAGAQILVKVWDPSTGQVIRTLRGHRGFILGLAFSPDGKHLASASLDGSIALWPFDK